MYVQVRKRKTLIRKESWQVRVIGDNHEVVLSGEKLHNRGDALKVAHKIAGGGLAVAIDG